MPHQIIRIHNIRCGLATNSSSSHSMIKTEKDLPETPGEGEYGWNDFTLTSETEKRRYVAAQIMSQSHLHRWTNEEKELSKIDKVAKFAKEICQLEDDASKIKEYYVDHSSVIELEKAPGEIGINPRAIKHLLTQLLEKDIVILGGNDNSDGHPLQQEGKSFYPEKFQETKALL